MSIKLKDTANITATSASSATSATKLQTARSINGTNFDGSANITTANWGTARTLTIGNTGKSVNGSGNVSWSLSEIGAAPAGYGLGTTCQDKSNQDCNNILVTGFYMGSNMTNKPSGCTHGWTYLLVMRHNDSWVRQVAYDFGTASQVYTRVKQNNSWSAWVATDTNTWRGVQDNLTSTATDQSLSANQGKVLKGLIDGKAASNHTHSYVPLANGGNITIHADSDSSSTGEYALIKAGHNELKIASSAGGTTVTKGQDKLTFNGNIVYHAGRKPTVSEIGAAAASHTHNYAGSSSAGGNANAAVKLATARSINGTNFDGSANITTANWGTARNLNGVSVNGSTNYTIPVENYYCNVNDNNTNLYHRILTTDIATANWVDKSLIIVMHSGYNGGGFGIAKITFRTNDISSAANSQGEIKWLVRNGFAANALVFNFVNQAKNACMDVFYKSPGTYAGMTWYVLSEGGRGGAHSKQWTKYNTNASGTNAYTEANMKTLRTYTSTLVSATDAGHVSTANSANTLTTARTINGTSFNGSGNITTANWGTARNIQIGKTAKSVNGSANVSWSLSEMGAMGATNANGYWGLTAPDGNTSNWIRTTTSGIIPYQSGGASALGTSSWPFSNAYINTVYGNLSGNASTATKLQTARTINGTNFDGTSNITTANWGTARTLTIGNTGKSVNGSGNVSWTLAEIGAAPSSSTSLKTTDKTIVGAINEVFQSGNSVKQNLVDTLIAKGAEDISTSNSWDSLIDIIEGSNISLAPASFTVEKVSGSEYGFRLLGSGPYYESENMDVHGSYAMCKLNIVCNNDYNVYLDCISYGESSYDYGIISQINTPLLLSNQADTTGVLKSFKGLSSSNVQSVQLSSESGFYYIKYIKDNSISNGNDSLRFAVRFQKKTGGNPDVPENPGGEETILFSSTIGGDNRNLTGGYTRKLQNSDSHFMYDASCMDLMAYSNGRGGSTLETVISYNKINLTNYSRLRIKAYFTTTTNDSGGAPLVGFDAVGNRDDAFAASIAITSSGQRYYDLDISGLTGNYHLKFNVTTLLQKPSTGEIIKHLYITELILYP